MAYQTLSGVPSKQKQTFSGIAKTFPGISFEIEPNCSNVMFNCVSKKLNYKVYHVKWIMYFTKLPLSSCLPLRFAIHISQFFNFVYMFVPVLCVLIMCLHPNTDRKL